MSPSGLFHIKQGNYPEAKENKDTKKRTLPTVEGKEEQALADDYGVPLMFYLSMRNRKYLLKCFLV